MSDGYNKLSSLTYRVSTKQFIKTKLYAFNASFQLHSSPPRPAFRARMNRKRDEKGAKTPASRTAGGLTRRKEKSAAFEMRDERRHSSRANDDKDARPRVESRRDTQ